jgi:hypothetical protein
MSIEKSNGLIRNRTRDLPACSIVPQPTTLPRAPIYNLGNENNCRNLFKHPMERKAVYCENRHERIDTVCVKSGAF